MRWSRGALIQSDWGPYKKRRSGHRRTQRGDLVRTQGKTATHMPRREASGETTTADNLILGFQPLEL